MVVVTIPAVDAFLCIKMKAAVQIQRAGMAIDVMELSPKHRNHIHPRQPRKWQGLTGLNWNVVEVAELPRIKARKLRPAFPKGQHRRLAHERLGAVGQKILHVVGQQISAAIPVKIRLVGQRFFSQNNIVISRNGISTRNFTGTLLGRRASQRPEPKSNTK